MGGVAHRTLARTVNPALRLVRALVWVNGEASGIAYHYDAYPHLVAVCAGFAVAPLSTLDDPIIDRLRAIYPRLDAAAAIALISLRVVDAWPSAGRRERETARAYPLCQF